MSILNHWLIKVKDDDSLKAEESQTEQECPEDVFEWNSFKWPTLFDDSDKYKTGSEKFNQLKKDLEKKQKKEEAFRR